MNSIRCVVVDDETLILQRMEKFFRKLSPPLSRFRLAGTARSAEQGIDLALETAPDIVITDIVMPGMDGIEMIERLKARLPHTAFIVLSAYPDFQYAQRAIAMNVLDYIVKVPLSDANLLAALEKAESLVRSYREKATRLQQLNMSVQGNIHLLRKQVMGELLRGELRPRSMELRRDELMLSFNPQSYGCMMAKLDDARTFHATYSRVDQRTLRYAVLNIVEEHLRKYGEGFACELEHDRFIGVITWRAAVSSAKLESTFRELGALLVRSIKQYLKLSVSVAFSKPTGGWDSLLAACREADEALEESFFRGRESVITPARRVPPSPAIPDKRLREWLNGITVPSTGEEAAAFARGLQEELHRSGPVSKAALLAEVREWLLRSEARTVAAAMPADEIGDLHELAAWIASCRSAEARGQGGEEPPCRTEIRKAKAYIRERLADRLTLQEVAEYVSLNASYFSVLFKKEAGEGFTDYVNRKRIERAIELLPERNWTNLELGEAVGIGNERYFCTLFKKITGTSPQKYRRGK
ncbi:response regulator transcription factor [Paenibacillus flagellatus]|uniref:DNA-binding response regulator n=1 Tax=Paenibacillus flagellatus TaxID=2211139 RepID=A0A2V5K149_9BACL|nr:response regulator [Paenibacillus flagellatus]PYI52859.1 hypothetical protein DLM86_17775 [Paenibacillus flagellatus]